LLLALLALFALPSAAAAEEVKAAGTNWAFNATIIEACSCPMFCQCYFNSKPSGHETAGHEGHGADHFCRANNVFKVNKGNYGATKLDGVRYWAAMDLGDDFSDGEFEWVVIHFDPSVTKEQRTAIAEIMGKVYPVKWKSFSVGTDYAVEWKATKDRAEARLDGGKGGEVVLNRFQGMSSEPIVIQNLRYFGVPRNSGFLMMPNEIETYRLGDKAFEFKGTNGFMITIDMTSKDLAPAKN
jgi:hypothetical protein